jgi:hypothetical protein
MLFESFVQERWAAIPPGSTIGKCLDSPAELQKLHRPARDNLLGEAERQIMQRYVQAFHAGISSGVALQVSDALGMVDGLHVNLDGSGALVPAAESASFGVGTIGAATFVGTTGEVRMTKADNGPRLKVKVDPRHSRRSERIDRDKNDWTFEAGDRRVDLRNSSVYDKLYHTRAQRLTRTAGAFFQSVVSGPKGVLDLAAAKKERGDSRKIMQETLDLLAARGAVAPGLPRTSNFAGMKDALYDHPDVAAYLGLHTGKQEVGKRRSNRR